MTAVAAGIAAGMVTLSGCSAATEGLIGLTVTESGKAMLVLAPCDGKAIGGGVSDVHLDAAEDRTEFPETKGRDLLSGGEPIQIEVDLVLEASMTYEIWASAMSDYYSTVYLESVTFTQADFLSLQPGEILTSRRSPYDVVPLESFARLACVY